MEAKSGTRFPGESDEYRQARNDLLAAEVDLRRQIAVVAAKRQKLPVGGLVPEDYIFEEGPKQVKLSELFGPGKDTLAIYSFMFGPNMKQSCPMCTSFLDSLDGAAEHAAQRMNLVVVARSPTGRIREFARERGWRRLRLLSSANNSYNNDYYGEAPDGSQIPSMNVFVRRDGQVHHFYHTEVMFVKNDPGMDERHVDMLMPLWNLLDLTPEGRGTDWYPRLAY